MRNPAKNNHQYGRELEQFVCNELTKLGIKARPSKGSGNKNELGDISQDGGHMQLPFIAECKHYNKPNITIKETVWKKLNNEIPLHSKRFPVYFLQNGSNTRLACLDVDDFFNILKEYVKNVECN